MKRILTLLLVLSLALAAFTSCEVIDKVKDMIGLGHEHSFVDGKCECGETDPDYVPTPEVDEGLQGAYDYIHQLYKAMGNTAGSYDLINSVNVGEANYTVTWTVDVESITITEKEDKSGYTVNVPALDLGDPAISYKLTFVVANAAGDTLTRTYDLVVPEFKVSTLAEYYAAEKGTALAVQGVVTGIMSKGAGDKENSIFLQDASNEGGYYVYALTDDPAGTIQVGMTVLVKGDKDIYNGTHEIKNASVEIVNAELTTVNPVDITEIFTNAVNTSAAELIGKQGLLVTIKGVTVLDAGSNGYYNWTLAGKNSYVRISSSSNCTTADQEATMKANFAENFYNKADVTGLVTIYNNAFYLAPISENAFSNFVEQEKPDNIKVEVENKALSVPSTIVYANDVTLPTAGANFSDVAISWALAETNNASLANNVLTPVLPESGEVTITLTATLTLNNETATKEFTVTIKALVITSVVDANTICSEQSTYTTEKYIVEGVIESIASDKYGNVYIKDAEGNKLYVYGIYSADGVTRYDSLTSQPKVGDKVILWGVLGQYNGANQMKSAWLLDWDHVYTVVTVPATCKDDGSITKTCGCGDVQTEVLPKGQCNYDENGVCTACGVKNHEHTTVSTGKVVAPTCLAGGYTIYACSDENCTFTENKDETEVIAHADADGDFKCDTNGCKEILLPEDGATLTIAQANAIGVLTTTTQKYYVTGYITGFYGSSGTTYGNVYIQDADGKSILVYGLYKDGVKYGDMTEKPAQYDTIKVYGVLTSYNGAAQFKNAELIEYTAHECTEYTEATCQVLAKCVVCGTTTGELADHNMVDGKCSVCGYEEGGVEKTPVTVSKSHTDIASIAGVTAGQNTGVISGKTIALDENISIVCAKGGATSDPCIYTESIRLYQNGATLTIKAAAGCEMTTITITLANNAAGDGPIAVTGGTADNASAPTNYVYTITVNPGVSEVVITTKGTDKNSRLYVANIEVNYKK